MRPTLLSLLPLLAACSCASGSAPYPVPDRPVGGSVRAHSGHGRVICESLAQLSDAVAVAQAIDEYFTLVAERLGYSRDEDVEVWLVPGHPVQATTYQGCIVFNPAAEAMPYVDLILAHEFVHWHAQGTVMQLNLPPAVVEGLCERLATDLTQRWVRDREALYSGLLSAARGRGDLPRLISQLNLSASEIVCLPAAGKHDLYALGFTLVSRIGVDALREAAVQGPVSPESILHLARVRANGTSF